MKDYEKNPLSTINVFGAGNHSNLIGDFAHIVGKRFSEASTVRSEEEIKKWRGRVERKLKRLRQAGPIWQIEELETTLIVLKWVLGEE